MNILHELVHVFLSVLEVGDLVVIFNDWLVRG